MTYKLTNKISIYISITIHIFTVDVSLNQFLLLSSVVEDSVSPMSSMSMSLAVKDGHKQKTTWSSSTLFF